MKKPGAPPQESDATIRSGALKVRHESRNSQSRLRSISRFQRLLINNAACPGPFAQAIALRAFGALLEAADLVTEMTEVKHPFQAGIKAQ